MATTRTATASGVTRRCHFRMWRGQGPKAKNYNNRLAPGIPHIELRCKLALPQRAGNREPPQKEHKRRPYLFLW
jgi:hypothetical protein